MTPHGRLCVELCNWFKERGIYYVRTNNWGYGRKGIPDILACYQGRFVAVEAKVRPDKPTAWQNRELNAIRAAKGIAIVAYSVEDLGSVFKP